MGKERQTNFGSGEVSPSLYARADLAQHAAGARELTNMLVTKYGTAINRSGTRYVKGVYDATKKSRLFTFDFSDGQQNVIEVSGAGYLEMVGGNGVHLGVPRYLAVGRTGASACNIGRTTAPAEDPTGTWDSVAATSAIYIAFAASATWCWRSAGQPLHSARTTA
jgi:hypothetical protein